MLAVQKWVEVLRQKVKKPGATGLLFLLVSLVSCVEIGLSWLEMICGKWAFVAPTKTSRCALHLTHVQRSEAGGFQFPFHEIAVSWNLRCWLNALAAHLKALI